MSIEQRDRLRKLAEQRDASMADTFDAALEALRRNQFFEQMAEAEARLRADPAAWTTYLEERDAWLNPDLSA